MDQLGLFSKTPPRRRSYVREGSERPADLERLEKSAETVEARVLRFFLDRPGQAFTPTMVAEALGLDVTSVRPRLTVLHDHGFGALERCAWMKRRETRAGGSEAFYRARDAQEGRAA